MSFWDDIGDALGDVADVVVDVVDTAGDAVGAVVGEVVGPVADAVSAIPIVGDVVEFAAPFGGMLGTLVGGPIGGMIGDTIGDQFGDGGGGGFDFLDTAIGMFGGSLPGPIADIAGNLLDGGSLIDTATSVFGGDLGGIASNLLGGGDLGGLAGQFLGGDGMPGLGDLGGLAQQFLGGEGMPDLGDLGGIAGQFLGGDGMPDLGDLSGIAQQFLGGEGGPDLGGLGNLLGAADSVFGGLGLGNLESAVSGIIGDCMPGLSDPGGWLDNLPDSIPGLGGGGFELPFGCGTFPSIPDIVGPITEAGGGWLEHLGQQAGEVAQQLPGGGGGMFGHLFDQIEDQIAIFNNPLPDLPEFGNTGINPTFEPELMQDFPDTDLDDLVFNLPGVDADRAARDALQQLAEAGGLGEALASMSSDDLTSLVSRLVTPVSPAVDQIQSDNDQIIDIDDGMSLGGVDATDGSDAGYNDPLGIGLDDLTAEPVGADAATSGLAGDPLADAAADPTGQVNADDFSLDGGMVGDGGAAPVEPDFTAPEPEPAQSDFSQAIDQANAVETQLDSDVDDMFEGLG